MLHFHTAAFILISFTTASNSLPVRSLQFKLPDDSISEAAPDPHYAMNSVRQPNQIVRRSFGNRERKFGSSDRSDIKRNIDVGIHIHRRTTTTPSNVLEQLENALVKALRLEDRYNASECPSCDEEIPVPVNVKVKPAFECDEWDAKLRTCILERNIGDTVTFYLSTGGSHRPNVTWRKEFHLRDSRKRQEVIINSENCPENIIIGRRGYELRISPITETDLGYNLFSATLHGRTTPLGKVFFMIRIVPIDLGFVYVGETIELDLRSFVTIPAESTTFRWYIEKDGEHGTLPSNMRTSGSSIKISELRQEQEGILACIVYTNLDNLATKKRFLLKDLVNNDDVLKSSPNDTIVFEGDLLRDKRDPRKFIRNKRQDNTQEKIEEDLMEASTDDSVYITTQGTTRRSYDYSLDIMNSGQDAYDNFNNVPRTAADDEYGFGETRGNADLKGDSPDRMQMDIAEDSSPTEVAKPLSNAPMFGNLQANDIAGNQLLQHETRLRAEQQQPLDAQLQSRPQTNRYSSNKESMVVNNIPGNENPLPQANGRSSNQKAHLEPYQKEAAQNMYIDIDTQVKDRLSIPQNKKQQKLEESKFASPRRISAEERIAKLISFCHTDYECSGSAVCVRTDAKGSGFCKCLPGFRGVGIFCRENIWLSNDFERDEFHNPDDFTFSSAHTLI